MNQQTQTRLERGRRMLSRIDGEAGQAVIDAMADIAPDFATYLFEYPFADIKSRPALGLREREIATVAALCALGAATPQLEVHIKAALNCGVSREEIVAIFMQMSVHAGFPAAHNGLLAAKRVFAALDAGTAGRE
jgi:4-carboxymuconolactone decarboxylase